MATAKQINFIESLARQTGGEGQLLIHEATLQVNGTIDDLTTRQASNLISDLLDIANTNPAPTSNLATDKQINYIKDLAAGLEGDENAEFLMSRTDFDTLTKAEASETIDTLKMLTRVARFAATR